LARPAGLGAWGVADSVYLARNRMISKVPPLRCGHRRAGVCLLAAVVVAFGSASSGQQPATPQTGAPRQLWPQRPGVFRPVPAAVRTPSPDPQPIAAAADEPAFVPNEVLVQFEADVPEDDRAAVRDAASAVLATTLTGDGRLERVTTSLAVPEAVAILQSLPQVEFAEPNWIVGHYATSNDPYYVNGSLWGMYGDTTTPASAFGSQAGKAWQKGLTGSSSVYVAVIDEGIDFTHPDLAPNIWTNPFDPVDGVDNDGNGRTDDTHGWDFANNDNTIYDGGSPNYYGIDDHGTHVAGTIGARGGNGIGVAGVAWNVTIISSKFLGVGGGTTANAILAVDYITDLKVRHGLDIIATSNSWGGGAQSTGLHQAIIRAAKQGILFVVAAGNSSRDNDLIPAYPTNYSTTVAAGSEAPASYEAVIAVAALDSSGARSDFSSYGPTTVDIGAPGSGVLSTGPVNGYQTMSGTSMATPHVTGAAALYKAAHPGASAREIREAILAHGIATPSLAGITATGRRLNLGEFDHVLELSIDDTRRSEGQAGTSNATFTVSLSAASSAPVTVTYTTADITAATGTAAANPTVLSIPSSASGPASPYPSSVVVPPGLGTVTNVRVALNGFRHTWPSDVDILLVGPDGQTCVLMSDVGSSFDVANLTLTFDDTATALPIYTGLVSGTYRPTNSDAYDSFPAPAGAGPHGAALSAFNGTSASGVWSLLVVDDVPEDGGGLDGGWSITLTTTGGSDYVTSSGTLTIPPGSTLQALTVPVVGDLTIEPSETFKVTLLESSGASIRDGVGIATIVNDDFTDLLVSGLLIRAAHIVELRAAVNEARLAKGLPAFAFTDPILIMQNTPVRAIHIVELRAALADAYSAAGLPLPVYTDSAIAPGLTVARGAHILELREAVASLP
jgi:subtilisin family serine protease